MKKLSVSLLASCAFLMGIPVTAEVIASSDTHYVLRHQEVSTFPADQLWQRLIQPSTWWHPEHTYSGDAKNLALAAKAGGLWREDWADGSVVHGRVMFVQNGKVLRMEAPFGPLQGLGAYVVWTITLKSNKDESIVVFEETATSAPGSGLDKLADAVDGVKEQAIQRLTSN